MRSLLPGTTAILLTAGSLFLQAAAQAQENTWTNSSSGVEFKWEDGINWLLGFPPSFTESVSITNAASATPNLRSRVVNIDAVTVAANSTNGCMTVNDLTLSAPRVGSFSSFNTLFLKNAGSTPLQILNSFTITSRGSLSITNSALQMSLFSRGTTILLFDDGNILLNTGSITADIVVGNTGIGNMAVSNGTWTGASAVVGNQSGSLGTLTLSGGASSLSDGLIVGNFDCSCTGIVNIAGGALNVSGLGSNGVLEIRSGTLSLSSGTLTVDTIIMTNACAHFSRTGGTLIYKTAVLDPNRDDDGDGFTNMEESQAGTDPLDPNSTPFHITAITQQGNTVVLTWKTAGGKTNVVQATKGSVGGSYSTNFTDLSSTIVPTGTGLTTTNYLDVGGATNTPARYYRVRLVP